MPTMLDMVRNHGSSSALSRGAFHPGQREHRLPAGAVDRQTHPVGADDATPRRGHRRRGPSWWDEILVNIEGDGRAVLDGVEYPFVTGDVAMVPEGLEHNIVNTGTSPMRLATVYAPPARRPGVVHHTKGEARRDKPPHSP